MNQSQLSKIKEYLDKKVLQYNNINFIENDPICIPHRFAIKQDIEIMGLFASVFAWGQRTTIIKKCGDLASRFDNAPYQFISQHHESDLKRFLDFKHRTFDATDLLYFISFLKRHYSLFDSLEDAFFKTNDEKNVSVEQCLNYFHNYFFDNPDALDRTRKHISAPFKKSACKRLNMYLRWMVRKDGDGVDFGIWNKFSQKDLICPLDLHVERTARSLDLITRKNVDWLASVELTHNLRLFDSEDPVKYDFALFGISVENRF